METAPVDAADRYVLLRRLERRLRQEPATTRELATEMGVTCRTLRRYLTVLQTAEEFRVELVQEGRCWIVFT